MFLSASRIEKNKAAGLGVAGRWMESRQSSPELVSARVAESGVVGRARRRYGKRSEAYPGTDKVAA